MNDAMKLENVKTCMNELNLIADKNFIYGQIDAKLWKYAMFSGFAALSIQHFILCFGPDKIVLIGVTTMGDFGNKTSEILRGDIDSIQYKKGLLQGSLTIKTRKEEIAFKVPKVVAVAPWQKENLENLIQKEFD